MTTNILGVSGSLRRESFNRKLLEAVRFELPEGFRLIVWERLAYVPPFDEDLEAGPAPAAVADLRAALESADGLLVATPEYNGSVPGQLKNAIDWASRPRDAAALAGKPAAVVGVSPSPFGAGWAQQELRKVLGTAGADVVDGHLPVPHAFQQFEESGRLRDDRLRHDLRALVARLHDRVRAHEVAA